MNYNDLLDAYKQQVNTNVAVKDDVNSIDPTDVASIGLQLADLLKPILGIINDFPISGGAVPPTGTATDLALYVQISSNFAIWRYRNSVWVQELSIPLGFDFGTGNISLQASVFGQVVSVSAGKWAIDGDLYSKATQTQLDLTPADLNFNRIDLVYANTAGNILLLDGVASGGVIPPDVPVNSAAVAYVYIPASSTGEIPYISDSNSFPPTDYIYTEGIFTTTDTGQTRIIIPHGLNSTPKWFSVEANNRNAGNLGISWKEADETNLYATLGFSQNDSAEIRYIWKAENPGEYVPPTPGTDTWVDSGTWSDSSVWID